MLKQENRPFLTIPEVSREFGFPVTTIKTLIAQKAFPVMKVGKAIYIMRGAFEKYLEEIGGQRGLGNDHIHQFDQG